jgi:hypothetical protein
VLLAGISDCTALHIGLPRRLSRFTGPGGESLVQQSEYDALNSRIHSAALKKNIHRPATPLNLVTRAALRAFCMSDQRR